MGSPLHVFSAGDEDYVVNPLSMRFAKVDRGTAEALRTGRHGGGEQIAQLIRSPQSSSDVAEPDWKFAPPDKLVLMLTYACNMACRYCCQAEIPDVRETEIPEEVARRAVDWLIEQSDGAREVGIGWFGGEPLMKFDLIRRIAAYAEQTAAAAGKRLRFGTMTNGLPLTGEVVDFLAEKQVETTVSLDGPPALQDANRPLKNGAPSYAVIAPRVKALTERCPDVEMRSTLLAGTDIDAVLAVARELGFRRCRIEKVSSSMTPGGMKNDESAATDDFLSHTQKQAERLLDAVRARDSTRVAGIAVDIVFIEAVRQAADANHPLLPGRRRWFMCGTGRQFLTVAVNGDIYPCPRFLARPEHKIGSIYNSDLRNEIHRRSPLFNADECPACWARFYCGGGCIVEHIAVTGSIFRVNRETCRWIRGKFEQAIRVAANLDEADRRFVTRCLPPDPRRSTQ